MIKEQQRYITTVLITSLLLFVSCQRRYCLQDVAVTDLFIYHIDGKKEYCKSFKSACKGDSIAFKYLTDQNYSDGAGYEHGYVVSIVLDSIGEEKVARWIESQYIDGAKLKSYLRAGQDWRSSGKEPAEERYPLLFR